MDYEIGSAPLETLRIDGGTQPRAELNEAAIADYAEAIRSGVDLPPVVAFFDGVEFWLADGFHRYHAHRAADMAEITIEIHEGTRRDAVLYSVGTNDAHGLRRTNEDKRRAIQTLLDDAEWVTWSDNAIAKACAVSHHTVASTRTSILANAKIEPVRTVERNGTTYEQNTSNIGKVKAAALSPAPNLTPAAGAPVDSDMPAILQGYDFSKDVSSDADMLAAERQENEILHAQLAAFQESDRAAELENQIRMRFGFEQQNIGNMTKVAQLDKELRYLGKLFAELRKILKVATNAEVLAAVRALLKVVA